MDEILEYALSFFSCFEVFLGDRHLAFVHTFAVPPCGSCDGR